MKFQLDLRPPTDSVPSLGAEPVIDSFDRTSQWRASAIKTMRVSGDIEFRLTRCDRGKVPHRKAACNLRGESLFACSQQALTNKGIRMQSEELFVRVVKVETWKGDTRCTNASGFFYMEASTLYLVTNRHVVIDEANGHEPDSIRLLLHTNSKDLTVNETYVVPLYVDGIRQWREHPTYGPSVDVAMITMTDSTMFTTHFIAAFGPTDILTSQETLPPGQSVLIVGFPLGFVDSVHNLPIIRQAVVASDFAHPFKGEPYFLTDARMHRGTSGAPVVPRIKRATGVAGHFEEQWCLLGVHSASLDVSDRDPLQDDRLGLNCAWYAQLIPEMVAPPVELTVPVNQLSPTDFRGSPAIATR